MKLHVSIRRQAVLKDYTQVKVIELTGISRPTIMKLWRGKGASSVKFAHLEKIAEVLECSPLEFFSVYDE
jgi:DNA-binding Xre family transcriptional regulator